jgi:hypothetical protein
MLVRFLRGGLGATALLGALTLGPHHTAIAHGWPDEENFEVWLVDQSNSPGQTYGGKISIYDGEHLSGRRAASATPIETIDLGADTASLCLSQTGANPVRPHMLFFNAKESHGVLSFVASGHVVFFNARTRTPVACLRMSAGAGGARQAHAAFPTPDDSLVLVANQNGKLLERIYTDYAADAFVHETSATLDLAGCTTPNGVACQDPLLRPDNAPICPFVPSNNSVTFVSLRGGGLFVVNHAVTPMAIVGEYTSSEIGGNGCGFAEAKRRVFMNAGGATAANLDEFAAFRLPMTGYSAVNPPNQPPRELLFKDDSVHRDAHGTVATKGQRYVWMMDRAGNVAEVFDAKSGARINTVGLTSAASQDPTPDLAVLSPDGSRMFVSLRGPVPLSGDPHASTGSTPGLGVIQVTANGRSGFMKAVVRISNVDAGGVERADAHGIALRRIDTCHGYSAWRNHDAHHNGWTARNWYRCSGFRGRHD